jgi:hypothetical protein
MGGIAPGMLYRGSHPIQDGKQDRAIALLAGNARIAAVLNLADTKANLARKAIFAPWYRKLFDSDCIIPLDMKFDGMTPLFTAKLKKGIRFLINREGPYLIHCHAGIDRTGFVCAVIEALMGATPDEIIEDYLISYKIDEERIQDEAQRQLDSLVIIEALNKMNDGIVVKPR